MVVVVFIFLYIGRLWWGVGSTVSSRVLKDDYITVYGLSAGLITYTSTLGGNITIPSMAVSKIDQ